MLACFARPTVVGMVNLPSGARGMNERCDVDEVGMGDDRVVGINEKEMNRGSGLGRG